MSTSPGRPPMSPAARRSRAVRWAIGVGAALVSAIGLVLMFLLAQATNNRAFYEQNPNARLRIFENSGMLPHDEEAPAFNAAVVEFLKQSALPPRVPAYFPTRDLTGSDAPLIAS